MIFGQAQRRPKEVFLFDDPRRGDLWRSKGRPPVVKVLLPGQALYMVAGELARVVDRLVESRNGAWLLFLTPKEAGEDVTFRVVQTPQRPAEPRSPSALPDAPPARGSSASEPLAFQDGC